MKYSSLFALIFMPLGSILAQNRILMVTSNQDRYGKTNIPAANHFEEMVVPYEVFTQAGFEVDFVSPNGGAIPIGYINTSDSLQKKYLYDGSFMAKLEFTKRPVQVRSSDYKAIFYSGGGAAMYGVPGDTSLQRLAREIQESNGLIAAICHGTAGLVYLKDRKGKPIIEGKRLTGFPDALENRELPYYAAQPFVMDKALQQSGGNFVYSKKGKDGFYAKDGFLITGQDPTSARSLAKAIVDQLRNSQAIGTSPVVSDKDQIREVLLDYIEGTANGQPERLRKAFHPQFNLYTVAKDTLWIRSGEQYIANIRPGEKSNRIGRILAIDIEKDAATAKAEIEVPGWRVFTDYFLLLKYQGAWKIVQKSYSWRESTAPVKK
jgi:putative intracellular protease/amidase